MYVWSVSSFLHSCSQVLDNGIKVLAVVRPFLGALLCVASKLIFLLFLEGFDLLCFV